MLHAGNSLPDRENASFETSQTRGKRSNGAQTVCSRFDQIRKRLPWPTVKVDFPTKNQTGSRLGCQTLILTYFPTTRSSEMKGKPKR